MKRSSALGLAGLLAIGLHAQQIELKGQVSIHNSKYNTGSVQYVSDAYVSAPLTKPSNSDSQGRFQLGFVGLDPGTSITLDVEKSGLEVVNRYDLQDVVIGRKTPLRVFVTNKGNLANAQTELYNVSRKALFAKKDALIARLRSENDESQKALVELSDYFGEEITDILEGEKRLLERIDELERQLPELALDLAAQNLDFASELYIQAYELFQSGQIEEAIDLLSESKLKESYKQIRESNKEIERLDSISLSLQENAQLQLDQLLDSYELKAKSFELLLDFESVQDIYIQMESIYLEFDVDPIKLAQHYRKMGRLQYYYLSQDRGVFFYRRQLEVLQEVLGYDDLRVAKAHYDLAYAQRNSGYLDESLENAKKDIAIRENIFDTLHPELAESYSNTAGINNMLGNYEAALFYGNRAANILELIRPEKDSLLAVTYDRLSNIYADRGELSKSLEKSKRAIEITASIYGSSSQYLVPRYWSIGTTYQYMRRYDDALDYLNRALDIQKIEFPNGHETYALTYRKLAEIKAIKGELEEADELIDKAIQIRLERFEKGHGVFANLLDIKGNISMRMRKYDEAIAQFEEALEIKKRDLPKTHLSITVSYQNIANAYYRKNDFKNAIRYGVLMSELFDSREENPPPLLARCYNNLAIFYMADMQFEPALEYLQRSIEVSESIQPIDPTTMARRYARLGIIHAHLGNWSKAKKSRDMASEIGASIPSGREQDFPDLIAQLNGFIKNRSAKE